MSTPAEVGDPYRQVAKVQRAHGASRWIALAVVEVVLAAAAVILDVGIPSVVILALMGLSLLVRREGPSTLGFRRVAHGWALAAAMLALAAVWTQ